MKKHTFIIALAIIVISVSCYMSGGKKSGPSPAPPAKPTPIQPAPIEKRETSPIEESKAIPAIPQKPSPESPAGKESPIEEKRPAKIAPREMAPVPKPAAPREERQAQPVPARSFTEKLEDKPLVKIKGKEIKELSGLTSAQRDGDYWGHADNGNEAEIYRFTLKGRVTQSVLVEGIENDDWEAITRAGNGNLLIGGIGDNDEEKSEYRIYECAEPKPGDTAVNVRACSFKYADGKSHNCEAFFVLNRKIYLITKEEDEDDRPLLFCLDRLDEKAANTARKVGTFKIKGTVTDAAYSAAHQILAVLTYSGIGFYSVKGEGDLLASPVLSVKADFGQCEGICFAGNDLVIANEKGEIWKYPLEFFLKK